MNDMTPIAKTTPKDWETDQEVRWCPGCGDYAVLKAVQRTMPEIGARPENTVFVSGIGCSSRFISGLDPSQAAGARHNAPAAAAVRVRRRLNPRPPPRPFRRSRAATAPPP